MSLSIQEHLNGVYQTTQTSGAGKISQKDTEAGKIERSAVSSSLDQAELGEDGVAITEAGRLQGAGLSAAPRRDTVEISAAGKAAYAASQGQAADSSAASTGYGYEPEDLSEYTDAELKQMYYRGEITRQEYEDETGEKIEG